MLTPHLLLTEVCELGDDHIVGDRIFFALGPYSMMSLKSYLEKKSLKNSPPNVQVAHNSSVFSHAREILPRAAAVPVRK
jgi:hypothetical protein